MLMKEQALSRLETDIKLRGRADSTRNAYTYYIRRFLDFCSHKKIEDIDEMDVRRYLEHLITTTEIMAEGL